MADDLFGGLGGLLNSGLGKTLSSFMPQDAPETQMFKASSNLSDLKQQEADILAEIGRAAFQANPDAWPQADKLRLIQSNIQAAEQELNSAKQVQEQADAAKAAADAATTCPSCGFRNPDGVKFCQECGTKLGAPAGSFCVACGAPLTPGTRFCGACGASQGA